MTPDLLSLPAPSAELVTVEGRAHFGIASAPFDVRTLSKAEGQALSFSSDAWYQWCDETWIGLRLPLVLGSVRQPAGSYLDEAAWGNPELRIAKRFSLSSRAHETLRLTLGAGIGIPLAEHAPSLLPNRVLAIAHASEGWTEPESLTPGALPFSPFAQFDYTSGSFRALGELKLPLLVRVSKADLPDTESTTHFLALLPVLQLEGRYAFSRRFGIALASSTAWDALPLTAHVRHVPPVQLALRTGPYFELGERGALFIDVQAPLGGALGGSTIAFGLHASLRF